MNTVVGIFHAYRDAELAVEQLRNAGLDNDHLTLLRPGTSEEQIEAQVPTSDSESPGMGEALGGAVGGAIGAAGGATLGLAVASLLLPGVGPVLIAGALGAALIGAGGAMAGIQAGDALEQALTNGLPHDELYVYEDALRKGHSVLIVWVNEDETDERVREILKTSGAESIDAARENWWLGVRNAEALEYEHTGGKFESDETSYRRGFEAALNARMRGKSFEQMRSELKDYQQGSSDDRPFRYGYERGQRYLREKAAAKGKAA